MPSTTTRRIPLLPLSRRQWLCAGATLLLAGGLATLPGAAHARADQTVVEAVQLPAFVERLGQRRAAEPGAVLRAGDAAVTASGSRMLLRMSDSSTIKLGEATEFLIQKLESEPLGQGKAQQRTAGLKLVTGVFRYATHYASKALGNTTALNLELATATVGIRGTDFWSMTDAEHDAVCVFEGHVVVERERRPTIDLQQPGAFWVVFTGQPEKPAGQATPAQLAKFIDQAEMQPGQGVVLQGGAWRLVAASGVGGVEAAALRERLNAAGYPARTVRAGDAFEVRINHFASEQDGVTVLFRLATLGVDKGRVTLVR